ncbi:hypothetical protein PED38_08045 [Clavibacter sp. CT19]|uniref:hypothetical protein n=1 Tax=Clavibacter sp. CT19 TaxID=3018990 RepID=UPI0022EB3644|nr:hypothetical protein [Clavibacter sp. CT19]MDA3804746.1 hypothetical protein [Clavibacter sp. CT19]
MRLATRITIGVLAGELVALAVLLLLADRWEDMGWPVIGMEHPLIAVGFALPPLVVLTAVVLVLLAGTRIVVAEAGAWRARREWDREQADAAAAGAAASAGLRASSRPAARR